MKSVLRFAPLVPLLAAMLLPLLSSAASNSAPELVGCTDLKTSLSVGSEDSGLTTDVTKLQKYLNAAGYLKANPIGYFGKQTEAAVKAFQSEKGISPLGIAGPATRAKIKEITCTGSDAYQGASDGSDLASNLPLSYLSISCSPAVSDARVGDPVLWSARISGAEGPYSYVWQENGGTLGRGVVAVGNVAAIRKIYQKSGLMSMSIDARSSDGDTFSMDCGYVDISGGADSADSSWYSDLFSGPSIFSGSSNAFDVPGPFDNISALPSDQIPASGFGSNIAAPAITGISVAQARIGQTVSLRGTGFGSRNAIIIDGDKQIPGEFSSDGSTLTFTVPATLRSACSFLLSGTACPNLSESFDPGYSYDLSVVSLGSDGVARESSSIYFAVIR